MRTFTKNSIVSLMLIGVLLMTAFSIAGKQNEDSSPLEVNLKLVAEGLTAPVGLVPAPDNSGRLLVVDQSGVVYILTKEGKLLADPLLDLEDRMVKLQTNYDERGLLSLAFHPNYKSNGRFFVYYSAPLRASAPQDWNHTSHVSEFTVSASNPNRADPQSEKVLLQIDEPQFNHDGGQLLFGPDGYLYISVGDGGGADDEGVGHPPMGNGQDITTALGAILRIDVDNGDPYAVPSDNPFVGKEGLDEIYAYGFRNPFRMSFDAGGDHQLFVGDVGQNLWEEVDIVTKGENYGWNIKEGTHCFDPQNPDQSPEECADKGSRGEPLVDPILEYPHPSLPDGIGLSVIGGYVYRGASLPQFKGKYIFGDWSSATVIEFAIPLDSGDQFDKALKPGKTYNIIVSYHQTSDSFSVLHTRRGSGQITLNIPKPE